jgi:7-keto-8-aminopelargonate synthetase-like enzyme
MENETDLLLATFSKSLASVGGVVAGPAKALHWIRHHARALIFTASMPPASLGGVLAALDVMRDEPERRERLWKNTRAVAEGLKSLGFDLGGSETPIIPVLIGDMWKTVGFWRLLFDNGIFTHPIVPPAVPPDRCRIRVSMSAEHSDEQVERVLEAFAKSAKQAQALQVSP